MTTGLLITFVFVLALLAAGCGVLGLTISGLQQKVRALESQQSTTTRALVTHVSKLANVEKLATERNTTALLARVDELSEAVERLRATHQRFAGRVNQRLGPRVSGASEVIEDDEIAAMIALQSAPSAGPNGGA